MNIYQGEPVGFKMNAKDDEGHYIPSFEGTEYEALLKDSGGEKICTWSTKAGSIEHGTETIKDKTAGWLSFFLDGKQTAKLATGMYSLEVAKVIDNGRAIGVMKEIINVRNAVIRNGV